MPIDERAVENRPRERLADRPPARSLAIELELRREPVEAMDDVVARLAKPVAGAGPGDLLLSALGLVLPTLTVFAAFFVVYRIVPNRRLTAAEIWPGALVATALWTALRIGFTFYATRIARYDSVFGPIAAGISLLVFLYFSSVIVLVGAEVTRASALEDEQRTSAIE